MKYTILKSHKVPAYLQLYRQLRDDIIQQIYLYGTKLPSKRLLADELGISTVTVEHAYALLCDEGYVEARERCGYIVLFRESDGFSASGAYPTEPSKESAVHSHPDFPLTVIRKTMRKVLADYGELLLEKSPNCGIWELREAISRYLARNRGMHIDVEQIIIGSGSEYLYRLIVDLLGRHLIYAIESPSYKKIEQVYSASEITYKSLPLANSGINSKALDETEADVLHTTPYRSYPSGVTASASKRHEYIRWSKQHRRYIIEDDFESEFSVLTKPTETLFSLSDSDNIIYLNTFSKTISPSLRIGYMVIPRHLVPVFDKKLGFYSCTVPTYMQYVLTDLIRTGDFERHINRVRRTKRKELSL